MESVTELFCLVDDCCRQFEPAWEQRHLTSGMQQRRRRSALSLSELMTLVVLFHQLRFRQFKRFYVAYACRHLRAAFPTLPSYHRCVEWLPRCAAPLAALFEALKGACDGMSIVDAPPWRCVITGASPATGSSRGAPRAVRPRWVGFMASSSTPSLIPKAN